MFKKATFWPQGSRMFDKVHTLVILFNPSLNYYEITIYPDLLREPELSSIINISSRGKCL